MKRLVPVLLTCVLVAVGGASGAARAQAVAPAPAAAPAVSGAEFLAKNGHAPGVVTLPSGLQYKIMASGPAGPSPKAGDILKVHYEGTLVSGQVFDSSFARGKPALLPLDGLVPGWMEAIPKMKVGDEWMLYLPPALGYGPEGQGPIPPNAVLIFRIKLLGMLSPD